MPTQTMALWALVAVAVMLGTVYAVIVPTRIDAQLGGQVKTAKMVSALMSGVFLSLYAARSLGFDVPGVELAAMAALFSGAGPALTALLVAIAPNFVLNRFNLGASKDDRPSE